MRVHYRDTAVFFTFHFCQFCCIFMHPAIDVAGGIMFSVCLFFVLACGLTVITMVCLLLCSENKQILQGAEEMHP